MGYTVGREFRDVSLPAGGAPAAAGERAAQSRQQVRRERLGPSGNRKLGRDNDDLKIR